MFHAYAARFDVTGNLEKFLIFEWTKHGHSFDFELGYMCLSSSGVYQPASVLFGLGLLGVECFSCQYPQFCRFDDAIHNAAICVQQRARCSIDARTSSVFLLVRMAWCRRPLHDWTTQPATLHGPVRQLRLARAPEIRYNLPVPGLLRG